jgi:hypothetical protein
MVSPLVALGVRRAGRVADAQEPAYLRASWRRCQAIESWIESRNP